MTFDQLNLIPPILKSLQNEGYENPTPIQEQAIPHILNGADIFGSASTGTGKTAAFSLPMLQLLHGRQTGGQRNIRAVILAPTRELAVQIADSINVYGRGLGLRHTTIYGGVSQRPQTEAIRRGVDILVATPGRLQDLINQGFIRLDRVEMFILDEADRMLDMGFINDIRRISSLIPENRQTLLFSATLPQEMRELVNQMMNNPVHVAVKPEPQKIAPIEQVLYRIDRGMKTSLLAHLLNSGEVESALVFTRTKHAAEKLATVLHRNGIPAESIHGNKSQNARQNALNALKARRVRVLVATDVASRGIDVDDLSHVVNYDLPESAETYTHRIGRTGRAGNTGVAISFCGKDETRLLREIEKLLKKPIPMADLPKFEALQILSVPSTDGGQNDRQYGRSGDRPQQGRSNDRPHYGRSNDRTQHGRSAERPYSNDRGQFGRSNDRPQFGRNDDRGQYGRSNDKPQHGGSANRANERKRWPKPPFNRSNDQRASEPRTYAQGNNRNDGRPQYGRSAERTNNGPKPQNERKERISGDVMEFFNNIGWDAPKVGQASKLGLGND